MPNIEEVIAQQASSLLDIPGVTGVGQGEADGKECVLVILEQDLPEIKDAIVAKLEGYLVAFEISGVIQAQLQ